MSPIFNHVQVLQEDVDAVLSNSFGLTRDPDVPEVNLQEERRKVIKEEIKQKVSELKSLLNEFHYGPGTTTTGSIGMGHGVDQSNKRRVRARRRKK